MKTRRAALFIAICVAGGVACLGQSPPAGLSINVAGFIRFSVPTGTLAMATYPFEDMEGQRVDAARLFGTQLPLGANIYAYDPDLGTYQTDSRNFFGWTTNITFSRGLGFWMQVPAGATGTEYQVYLSGELPELETGGGTTSVRVVNGTTQLGYAYPTPILWTNTQIAEDAAIGDVLHRWNGSAYVSDNRGFLGWSDPDLVLLPGEGFFYETSSTQAWTEVKPYTWP